jgi:hypothetical protein
MNNAKIWILITGIVVIVSGFLLYSTIRTNQSERTGFLDKINELASKATELERLKKEVEETKKLRTEFEAKSQSEIAALEAQLADSKRNESLLKSRMDALSKEKESMSQFIENNNAIVAKLNKKIEAIEKERDLALQSASSGGASPSSYQYVDPIEQSPDATSADAAAAAFTQPMGAKLAEEEIVDLGRIIVHPTTHEAARVEHVNPLYGFIVLSAGTNDGLQKDSVVNITRNNRLVAKAVVKKVREDAASAVTLPEWTREEIRVGDLISTTAPSPMLAS